MKKLALLAAMIFALSMSATAMPALTPDDNLNQLSQQTQAKTEAMKKYNEALKKEAKAKKDVEKAAKKVQDAERDLEKARQKVRDAEKKVEKARKDYDNAVNKAKEAEQKTIEAKRVIDQMDGIIVNDGYNR